MPVAGALEPEAVSLKQLVLPKLHDKTKFVKKTITYRPVEP